MFPAAGPAPANPAAAMAHARAAKQRHPKHRASPGVVRSRPKPPEMAKLSLKHQMFIEAFLANGGNATDAALKAGYSPKNPNVSGYKVHKLPYIKAAIAARQEEHFATHFSLPERIIREYEAIGFTPITDLFEQNKNGTWRLKPLIRLSADTRQMLKTLK